MSKAKVDQVATYLDRHSVYQLFSELMEQLLITRPPDPLAFLVNALETGGRAKRRIFVCGPPGSPVSLVASRASSELGLVHLSAASFGAEGKAGSDPAKLAAAFKARVAKEDCLKNGYIVTELPRSSAEALALTSAGLMPSLFLYLSLSEPTAEKRLLLLQQQQQQSSSSSSSSSSAPSARSEVHEHFRALPLLSSHYAAVLRTIDAERQGDDQVYAQARDIISRPEKNLAPHRSLRVSVIGCKGSGARTQSGELAARHGLVHITVGGLLRAAAPQHRALALQPEKVPDEVLCPLVIARLAQPDCKRHGYVLSGFPMTLSQAAALEKAGVPPLRVVLVDVPQEVALKRIAVRKAEGGDRKKEEAVLQAFHKILATGKDELKFHYGPAFSVIDGSAGVDTVALAVDAFVDGALDV